ncbi:sodium- and chloride-dependent betaine transporter-like [Centropristis striata]|uniref:sodium- and chloride-dependent betaine transporter-like n=1 Tax=Centropristis striata TaxID=184440 RepID=UPI0027DFE542|nr:sodium- and chloride-dependent betaine transporter-like [Centropristis striata]
MTEETARGDSDGGSGPDKGAPEAGVKPRRKWANNTEFMLSMAGHIMSLGNIWRFPFLFYKNGGAAFLLPYFVLLFFCGIPVFFLEVALGQYTSEGGATAWRKICPMFQGVGIASQVVVGYLNIYYIVILAWTILYLFYSFYSVLPWSSFYSVLPWSTCENHWNTEQCHSRLSDYANPHLFQPGSNWSFLNNITSPDLDVYNVDNFTYDHDFFSGKSPEEEFWNRRVLRASDRPFVGNINWDLALCLLIAWVLCYLCVFKGIKYMGKVVYFTATFPYLLMIILFFRGVTLPGAWQGIRYYLMPDFSRIAQPDVWFDAAFHIFFSYSMCSGVLTSLGSYNKYNNNCYRDCLLLCGLNTAVGLFAGFVVFSMMGFLAFNLDVSIGDVMSTGPNLAFQAFPKVLAMLPAPSFWSVLFFLMILFMGLHSQFVAVESLATVITDLFPRLLRKRREVLVAVIATVCFLLGLPLITEGGIYLFTLIDNYGPCEVTILFIAGFEVVVIAWVYGVDRFCDNIEDMIGYRPFPVMKYCWLFFTPFICWVTILYGVNKQHYLLFAGYYGGTGPLALVMLIMMTPLFCIPLFIFFTQCKTPEKMTISSSDLRQARPNKPLITLCGRVIRKARVRPNRHVEENEKVLMEDRGVV